MTCIEAVEIRNLAQELVAVAVDDQRILIYYDKHLVDTITVEKTVVAMRFGSYGREKNVLILISEGKSNQCNMKDSYLFGDLTGVAASK